MASMAANNLFSLFSNYLYFSNNNILNIMSNNSKYYCCQALITILYYAKAMISNQPSLIFRLAIILPMPPHSVIYQINNPNHISHIIIINIPIKKEYIKLMTKNLIIILKISIYY